MDRALTGPRGTPRGSTRQSLSSLTGQPEEQLLINITEVDASTVMEAGVILPQPGEEAAWFEHNRAHLSALAPDGAGLGCC